MTGKGYPEGSERKWEDSIRIDLKEIRFSMRYSIDLAQDIGVFFLGNPSESGIGSRGFMSHGVS